MLVDLILAKAPPPTDGSMAFETYPLLFTGQTMGSDKADFSSCLILSNHCDRKIDRSFIDLKEKFTCHTGLSFSNKESRQVAGRTDQPTVPELVLSLISQAEEKPIADLSQPWAALVLLPHVRWEKLYLFSDITKLEVSQRQGKNEESC